MRVSRTPGPALRAPVLATAWACCAPVAQAAAGAAPTPPSRWTAAAGGLETRTWSARADRPDWPAWVVLVRLDPSRHRVRLVSAPDGGSLRVRDLVAGSGALAAVNGGFFDDQGRPLGWRVADGRPLSALARSGWSAFVVRADGSPAIVTASKAAREGRVLQAVQAGPRLVEAGRVVALRPQSARRAFIGLEASGRVVLGTTAPLPADATALARFLAAPEADGGAGLVEALALDGGSSAQLHVRGAGVDGGDLDVPGGVAVPDALLVEPLSPSP